MFRRRGPKHLRIVAKKKGFHFCTSTENLGFTFNEKKTPYDKKNF